MCTGVAYRWATGMMSTNQSIDGNDKQLEAVAQLSNNVIQRSFLSVFNLDPRGTTVDVSPPTRLSGKPTVLTIKY